MVDHWQTHLSVAIRETHQQAVLLKMTWRKMKLPKHLMKVVALALSLHPLTHSNSLHLPDGPMKSADRLSARLHHMGKQNAVRQLLLVVLRSLTQ